MCYLGRAHHLITVEGLTYRVLARRISAPAACSSLDMKKQFRSGLLVLATAGLFALSLNAQPVPLFHPGQRGPQETEPVKRFDLNFKGGVPKDLIQAIENAAGMPVNVFIPEGNEDFLLPAFKLKNVSVSQLFHTLGIASSRAEYRRNPGGAWQHATTSYGFRTPDQPVTTNSIWYFYVEGLPAKTEPVPPPIPQVRFWNLESYLDKLKVEDITTAIETGWKMGGVNPLPKLTFHKDTKLLVVLGQDDQLRLVDDVLRELRPKVDPPKSGKESAQVQGENPSKR